MIVTIVNNQYAYRTDDHSTVINFHRHPPQKAAELMDVMAANMQAWGWIVDDLRGRQFTLESDDPEEKTATDWWHQ